MNGSPAIRGQALVAELKAAAGCGSTELCLPVGRPVECLLRPVATRADRLNPADVAALTAWRNRHVTSFLTEFEATEERTARWLVEAVGPRDGKILFMVDDPAGEPFGYMGLDFMDWGERTGEADAVVRGRPAPPGTMGRALAALLGWAERALELKTLGVRVRSDNPACGFYAHIGFAERARVPLRRVEEGPLVRYVEDPTGGPVSLVHMIWRGRADR